MAQYTNYILVCGGTGCRASQSEQIIENLRAAVEQYGLEDTQVIRTGCFGFCEKGPVVKMIPDNTFYVQVQPSDADEIVREHLVKGRKVERLLYMNPETRELVPDSKHIRFYKKQLRIALRNCGFINPENIDEYIARDGYVALGKALVEMTPEEVIKEIMDSGLRGRGGGGFPTGLKWQITRKVQAPQKYVVCNADEGDPGAFMDRSILEGDPHSIVEAMAINGYCTGASKGLVYIRAEYPLAVERLKIAIRQAKEYGLLGENIFGTDFSFDIEIRYGAGAFVCGEETALIHSMEGLRGEATVKPPFPSEHGYKGCPTNVNNVETYANIPMIIKNGADWYSRIGTPQSPGTKAFALTGNVKNTGLIEVPMGISLREIIFDIGGGIKDDKGFKAVQIGGPSGGCLVESQLDSKMDFDSLSKIGAMIGSGGLVVMDEYNVPVIEDAAESLGATYKGKQTGTMGKYGIYSFNGNKIIKTPNLDALAKEGTVMDWFYSAAPVSSPPRGLQTASPCSRPVPYFPLPVYPLPLYPLRVPFRSGQAYVPCILTPMTSDPALTFPDAHRFSVSSPLPSPIPDATLLPAHP